MGRIGSLQSPVTLDEAVNIVKKYLHLDHIRLATAAGTDNHLILLTVLKLKKS